MQHFVFKYQYLDFAARIVDFIGIWIMPVTILLFMLNKDIIPANSTIWLIIAAYYAIVIVLLMIGAILNPDKHPLILGWYVKKIENKELKEFGKLTVNYPKSKPNEEKI